MSMWSIMAAPLLAGNDIRNMSQTTTDTLLNAEVIAVDQDAAGIQGTRIKATNGLEVWCKPLGSANGTTKAVALLNRNASASNITVNFTDIGLSGSASVRDLWAKADKGSFTGSYSMSVPSHGAGMLKIAVGGGTGGAGGTRIALRRCIRTQCATPACDDRAISGFWDASGKPHIAYGSPKPT
jgi:alpha-galactosidase